MSIKDRTHKNCKSCATVKPIEEFYKNKSQGDGHDGMCKPCRRARNKRFHAENPDYVKNYYYEVDKPKQRWKNRGTNKTA